jgi:hypothetical protein
MQLITQEELNSLYEQLKQELQAEDFCGIDYYLTAYGNKPQR